VLEAQTIAFGNFIVEKQSYVRRSEESDCKPPVHHCDGQRTCIQTSYVLICKAKKAQIAWLQED